MASDQVRQALLAILSAIEGIEETVGDRTLEEYASTWSVKHAVERGIEIISEASRRVPQSMRARQPTVEWKQIHGIGNILRHDYDEIADEVIFRTVRESLPTLRAAVRALLAEPDERNG